MYPMAERVCEFVRHECCSVGRLSHCVNCH